MANYQLPVPDGYERLNICLLIQTCILEGESEDAITALMAADARNQIKKLVKQRKELGRGKNA